MLAKILICSCYIQKFYSEGNDYVKKLTHSHCKCEEKHLLYVLFWEKHPQGSLSTPEMEKECTCVAASANDVCDFCVQIKYLLNFKYYKLCLERIPVSVQDKLITTPQYFKVTKGCQPFFYFNKERNVILVSLDNPAEPKISVRTDHIHFSPLKKCQTIQIIRIIMYQSLSLPRKPFHGTKKISCIGWIVTNVRIS